MQASSADLENVLAFVIDRITEEAERSGVPLSNDEIDLLNHLPTQPTNPTASWDTMAYEGYWPTPILRDLRFERLCNLAEAAYRHDLHDRQHAAQEWEFAGAVLKVNRQPLSWLLQWAHIRSARRSERWDRFWLVGTATFIVMSFLLGTLALSLLTAGRQDVWKWTLIVVGGCIYCTLLVLIYFGVRRLEFRQQERHIEKYRCDLPSRNSTPTRR